MSLAIIADRPLASNAPPASSSSPMCDNSESTRAVEVYRVGHEATAVVSACGVVVDVVAFDRDEIAAHVRAGRSLESVALARRPHSPEFA